MSRLIYADSLKRKAQRIATESWKMGLTARIETTLNQFIDWIDNTPTVQPKLYCALREFGDCSYSETGCSDCAIKEKIRNALSIQPERAKGKWIPCSERLPKKMGYYLTSNEYKVVHEDYYWGNGCFEKAKKYQCEVVAWMPMPIPPYCGGNGE